MTLPAGASHVQRVGGGDINEAFKVRLGDGREAFVKTRDGAVPGEYAAEAAGLQWLAQSEAVRTPRVLEVDDRYLALQWIAQGGLSPAGEEELGAGLAAMHAAGAPGFGDFGLGGAHETEGVGALVRFGDLTLSNEPARDWPAFYAQRRLLPLARLGRERDALSAEGVDAVQRLCDHLADLCGESEPPARLHGDLWQGNVMADQQGRPWLIDPCAYGGHREVDLAMLSLFGSVSQRTLAAYQQRWPLAAGWQQRVGLYQLLPLLVHALLFGGHYRARAERVAARYAG